MTPTGRPGGHPTHWQIMGQGPRQALLIHCSLSRSSSWSGLMRRLDHQLTALAFDLPGHGRSGDWDGHRDMHDLTTAIAADLLGPGQSDLIGHSFGATVALRLALEHPDRVRSLILIEPVLFAAAKGTPAFAENSEANARMIAALSRGDVDAAAQEFTARWGIDIPWPAMPDFQRAYVSERMQLVEAGTAALFDDRPGLLREGRLEALGCPVLLIEGALSPPVVAAIDAVFATRLPDARRARIAAAGHMAPITHPRDVAAVISDFLRWT